MSSRLKMRRHAHRAPSVHSDVGSHGAENTTENLSNTVKNKSLEPKTTLILRTVPMGISSKAIRDMCSKFGTVDSFFPISSNTKLGFVNFSSVVPSSLDAAIQELAKFGIISHKNKEGAVENGDFGDDSVSAISRRLIHQSGSRPHNDGYGNNQRMSFNQKNDAAANTARNYHGQGGRGFQNHNANNNFPQDKQNFNDNKSLKGINFNGPAKEQTSSNTSCLEGPCNYCRQISKKICKRCSDFYCSTDCQIIDWPSHRYICFPMPDLVNSDSNDVGLNLSKKSPGVNDSGSDCTLTSIGNASFESKLNNLSINNKTSDISMSSSSSHKFHNDAGSKFQNQTMPSNFENTRQNQKQNTPLPNQNVVKRDNPFSKEPAREVLSDKKSPSSLRQGRNESPNVVNSKNPLPKQELSVAAVTSDKKASTVFSTKDIPRSEYPKNGSLVNITAVVQANRVYIRSLTKEDNEGFIKTLERVNNEAKNSKPLKAMPSNNTLAITNFQGDDLFYRVTIVDPVNEDKIKVAFIDFGNTEYKKLSELREFPPECINLKRYSHFINLKYLKPMAENKEALAYMKMYEDDPSKQFKLIYDGSDLEAELIDVATSENINQKITILYQHKEENAAIDTTIVGNVSAGETEKAITQQSIVHDEPVFEAPFEIHTIPESKDAQIVILDNSFIMDGIISCCLLKDLEDLENFCESLQEYGEKDKKAYMPEVDEFCLALYEAEDRWYRGRAVKLINEKTALVELIDYGTETEVNFYKIRRYPKELTFPCKTNLGFIDDLPRPEDISDKLANRLKELVECNTMQIADKIYKDEDGTMIVQLNETIKQLTKENLI